MSKKPEVNLKKDLSKGLIIDNNCNRKYEKQKTTR